jgi:hypothetical protein
MAEPYEKNPFFPIPERQNKETVKIKGQMDLPAHLISGSGMFRRSVILVCSLLLASTLSWGGCVASPQFPQLALAGNSCCEVTGHCKTTNGTASQGREQLQEVRVQKKVVRVMQLTAAARPGLRSVSKLLNVSSVMVSCATPRPSTSESSHDRQSVLSTFLI